MPKIYAKYDLKEIMKIEEEFLREEVYEIVNRYYSEYEKKYPKIWQSSIITDPDTLEKLPLFDLVDRKLSEKLNIPVSIANYFENLHGVNLFHNGTNNFGLQSLIKSPDQFHRRYRPNPFITESIFGFYPEKVSVVLHDFLKTEHFKKHLALTIKYRLKKHFLRGRISNFWLALDLINKYGYQHVRKYYSISGLYHLLKDRTKEKTDVAFQKEMAFVRMHSLSRKKSLIFCYHENDRDKYLVDLHGQVENSGINWPYGYPSMLTRVDIEIMDIINDPVLIDEYFGCEKGVENEFRSFFGLPNLGEGWVNETKLFHLIRSHFSEHLVIQHAKTPWLKKQHLDIYFPFLNIAIEYHGKQHFEPVEYFGGHEAFLKNQERDSRKKGLCEKHNCHLIEVMEKYNLETVISELQSEITRRKISH